MPFFPILLIMYPLILDSTILSINTADRTAERLSLNEEIIDYVPDTALYVLTEHNLYKINPRHLKIMDHIPLPVRFNYFKVDQEDIALISSNEIVVLKTKNLNYKMGIGVDYADYQPLLIQHNIIYLKVDTEKRSIIKKFDLRTGHLIKKLVTSRIQQWRYDTLNQRFIFLDINNRIMIINRNLKKEKTIKLKFDTNGFIPLRYGLLLFHPQAVSTVDKNGLLIDFQPLPAQMEHKDLIFYNKDIIINLDSLTIRIKRRFENRFQITDLYHLNHPGYAIGINKDNKFFFLRNDTSAFLPLSIREIALAQAAYPEPKADSLWYIQIGAFSILNYAQHLRQKFLEQGIPVFIDSSGLYRVKLGGFRKKEDAVAFIETTHIQGWIVLDKILGSKSNIDFNINKKKEIIEKGGKDEGGH